MDCIIVLANEMDKDGNLNSESLERIQYASQEYFKTPSSPLITCGWDYRKDSTLCIAEVMKDYGVKLGIPPDKILVELNSRDTVGDAFFTKINILKPNNWKKALVVTSDYHVLRTEKIFKFIYGVEYEINVIGAPRHNSVDKYVSEKQSLDAFERTFINAKTGDDVEIFKSISSKHPFYNGEIYSKINMNF